MLCVLHLLKEFIWSMGIAQLPCKFLRYGDMREKESIPPITASWNNWMNVLRLYILYNLWPIKSHLAAWQLSRKPGSSRVLCLIPTHSPACVEFASSISGLTSQICLRWVPECVAVCQPCAALPCSPWYSTDSPWPCTG